MWLLVANGLIYAVYGLVAPHFLPLVAAAAVPAEILRDDLVGGADVCG